MAFTSFIHKMESTKLEIDQKNVLRKLQEAIFIETFSAEIKLILNKFVTVACIITKLNRKNAAR